MSEYIFRQSSMQRAQSKDGGSVSPGNCHSSGLECRDHKPPIQLFLSETRRSAACVCVHITPPPSVRFSNESRSAGLRSQLKHKHSKTISQHFVPLLKTPISRFSLFSWIQMASTFNHFHSPAADTQRQKMCLYVGCAGTPRRTNEQIYTVSSTAALIGI